MRDPHKRRFRGPSGLLVGSAVTVAAILWLLVRSSVVAVTWAVSTLAGSPPRLQDLVPLGFTTTLIVTLVVAALMRLDANRMREGVFRANLGLADREVVALASGCAVVLELALAVVLRAATGA